LSSGCGYSEDQWQAQLAKYNQLKSQKDDDDAKLADAQNQVAALTKQLQDLGVNVSNIQANLDDTQKALADYKERARQLEVIKARFETLKAKLDTLTSLGLNVNVRHNRMVISLPGDVLFDSGRETLKKDGKDILLKVAGIIKADPQLVSRDYEVAGHTDNQPLAHGPFKDNWGLSLMRAREVLVFLIDPAQGGLPVAHWSAAGFADSDPVADNSTPDGRQKNRRCELIVLPSVEEMLDLKTITQQPAPAPASPATSAPPPPAAAPQHS
jgi:chemotaxis protein MotB